MKKLALAIAAVMACGAVSVAQAADTLAKIKAAGKIVIGTRDSSAPLAYTTGDGKYTGYHVDVCLKIADAIKANLKAPTLPVEYTVVTSANRVPLVQNGTVDMECGSTTNNTARQKQVAFAPTTFVTNVRIGRQGQLGHHLDRPAERQDRRDHHRHHLRAAAAQAREGRRASTSRSCSARTTPTASCCSNRAVPMRS